MPPTSSNNMASIHDNSYNENGVHSKVIETFTKVCGRLARNIPNINKEALTRRIISGLGVDDDGHVAGRHMRNILTNKELGIVPEVSGQCVDLISRPRKGVPIRECITTSLQEMDRTGNSIRWGMLMSYPASGSAWAVFHAVNYDRKHKVYYETEDRSEYTKEFQRGLKAGIYFPFDLTDAFYKEVYKTWATKGGRTPAVKPYRIDLYMLGDGRDLDTYHIVGERGGFAARGEDDNPANDGHRLGVLTYYGMVSYEEDEENFSLMKVRDAATGEFAVLD